MVPATMAVCSCTPLSRSSTRPRPLVCTITTPTVSTISAMALKAMMRQVSAENCGTKDLFAIAIADAIQRLDRVEIVGHHLELLAQPLDVAVDRAVVDIDLVVIGRVHQAVAALHEAGPLRQRLQDEEFRHGETHRL